MFAQYKQRNPGNGQVGHTISNELVSFNMLDKHMSW